MRRNVNTLSAQKIEIWYSLNKIVNQIYYLVKHLIQMNT